MTSGKTDYIPFSPNNIYQGGLSIFGNVGLGIANPAATLDVVGDVKFTKYTDVCAGCSLDLTIVRSRGTQASPTTVLNGDTLGLTTYRGYNGSTVSVSSAFGGIVDGTVSTGIVPGALTFSTADSAGTLVERMRINAAGNVGIGTTNPGALLDLGTAGTKLGVIRFAGSTSGNVTVQPAVAAGTWTLTLPTAVGSAGQQLTDAAGNGVTSWTAASSKREYKNILGTVEPKEALSAILRTPVYRFKYKP